MALSTNKINNDPLLESFSPAPAQGTSRKHLRWPLPSPLPPLPQEKRKEPLKVIKLNLNQT